MTERKSFTKEFKLEAIRLLEIPQGQRAPKVGALGDCF